MRVVWNTAVHWTNGSTLRFIVKAYTFGTFIRNYVVNLVTNWFLGFVCIYFFPIWQYHFTIYTGTIFISPIICTFINGIVWTFWFASATVYTFICYYYCHNNLYFLISTI